MQGPWAVPGIFGPVLRQLPFENLPDFSPLGQVAGLRMQCSDSARTEARGDCVSKRGQFCDIDHVAGKITWQGRGTGIHAFGTPRLQHQKVNPEARVERRDLLSKQGHEMAGPAHRTRRVDLCLRQARIAAIGDKPETARSAAMRHQTVAQLAQQAFQPSLDASLMRQRLRAGQAGEMTRRRAQWCQRLMHPPQRLIKTPHHVIGSVSGRKTPGQCLALQTVELADLVQAEAPQQRLRRPVQPQR